MNIRQWLRHGVALTVPACLALACNEDLGADDRESEQSPEEAKVVTIDPDDDDSDRGLVAPVVDGEEEDDGEDVEFAAPTVGQGIAPPGSEPEADLLVALMGDQGSGSDTKAVYQLIKEEGADFLIIAGDFDYKSNPGAWEKEMNAVLGADYPVFGAIGNHDVKSWSGYQSRFEKRLEKITGASCSGDLGVDSSCTYKGLHFVLSGLGTIGSKSKHEKYLEQALTADESLWSLCVWHKNQRDLQAGDKKDEIGWTGPQICQTHGAIIVMAHEHSYARTMTVTDLGNKNDGHGAVGMPELLEVGPGSTFSVVSGLGGKGARAYDKMHDKQKWWASIYASNYHLMNGVKMKGSGADSGAMFIRFHVDGDPNKATGYFKNIQGETIDEFDIVRK
jgi:hypothetical protein